MGTMQRFIALVCGVLSSSLHAASLGDLEIRSSLSRPLLAVVQSTIGEIDEDDLIDVRIVEPGWAEDPGLQARMRESSGSRRRDIVITSDHPVYEPMFTLRLQVRADNVVLTREYPVILEPFPDPIPIATPAEPAAVASATPAPLPPQAPVPAVVPEPAAPPVTPPRSGLAVAQSAAFDTSCSLTPGETPGFDHVRGVYGPVTDGESLRLVALRLRPWRNCVPLQVLMSSIYRHNTEAFYGTPDRLRAGRVLQVPPVASLRSLATELRSRDIPRPPAPAVRPDDEPGPALPASLLTGLISTAQAAPPEVNFAALEMTAPPTPRPVAIGSAMAAPQPGPGQPAQGVPIWALVLVMSSCGMLLLRKRRGEGRSFVVEQSLRD